MKLIYKAQESITQAKLSFLRQTGAGICVLALLVGFVGGDSVIDNKQGHYAEPLSKERGAGKTPSRESCLWDEGSFYLDLFIGH